MSESWRSPSPQAGHLFLAETTGNNPLSELLHACIRGVTIGECNLSEDSTEEPRPFVTTLEQSLLDMLSIRGYVTRYLWC